MNLRKVKVVANTEIPIGIGKMGAVRCLVEFEDGSTHAAILKRMDSVKIGAEIFSAILLRAWGLPVPEPLLVDESPVAFASLDVDYPNLYQRLGWSNDLPDSVKESLLKQAASWLLDLESTALAVTADEAINNRDRNIQNILFDGKSVAWIDHEHTFGLSELPDANKLATLLQNDKNWAKIQNSAVAVALTLARMAVEESVQICSVLDVSAFESFVVPRLSPLANMVLRRFPAPNDLLSGA